MTAPATRDAFLELVRKSGLMTESLLAADGIPDEPKAAAEFLIRKGLLTRYQSQQLLAGRHKGFFLGTYKLLDPIGRGGMGIVYLAEHVSLHRRVAIKVFPPDKLDDESALKRFYREGRTAAALDHKNIVRVFDINQAGSLHFLIMEYVEGQTLDKVVAGRGPLPVLDAAWYVAQAARGLQHAHERGVIHRDIKPSNLVLDRTGTIKILDMGLARFFDNRNDHLTHKFDDAAVLGTADYIAPEQALDSRVDIRADIYSLGATLHTLLAGKPPFGSERSVSQKLLAHQMRTPTLLHFQREDVPAELSAVIAKMTAKKPEERYQTPQEVYEALVPWLPVVDAVTGSTRRLTRPAAVTVTTPVPPPAPPSERKADPTTPTKSRRPAILAAVMLVAALGIGGWWLAAGNGGTKTGDTAHPQDPNGKGEPNGHPDHRINPGTVYRLSLGRVRDFAVSVAKGQDVRPPGLPADWNIEVYREGTKTRFSVESVDGSKALRMTNEAGSSGGMAFLNNVRLPAGRRTVLRVEYLTRGGANGLLRFAPNGREATDVCQLSDSSGKWRTAEFHADLSGEQPGRFEVHNVGEGDGADLSIRALTVTDAGSLLDEAVTETLDFTAAAEFSRTVDRQTTVAESGGGLPASMWLETWMEGSRAEAAVRDIGGVKCLVVTNVSGEPTGMLFLRRDGNVSADRAYRVRIRYATPGRSRAIVKWIHGSVPVQEVGLLDDTAGEWKTTELPLLVREGGLATLEIHNCGRGPGNELRIACIEFIDGGLKR